MKLKRQGRTEADVNWCLWQVNCPRCGDAYELVGAGRWLVGYVTATEDKTTVVPSAPEVARWDSRDGELSMWERPVQVFRTRKTTETCMDCLTKAMAVQRLERLGERRAAQVTRIVARLDDPRRTPWGYVECPCCFREFAPRRRDQVTCGGRCRERKRLWLAQYRETGTLSDVILNHITAERQAAMDERHPSEH